MATRPARVARLYIFKPNIQIWEYFGGPWNVKCWHILWPFGIFDSNFVVIWYIFHVLVYCINVLVYCITVLVSCTKKNLATLQPTL
jgi:hypothetical protein